eukprot:Nk52_evm12s598 gene=Nk52_evmTU12s598
MGGKTGKKGLKHVTADHSSGGDFACLNGSKKLSKKDISDPLDFRHIQHVDVVDVFPSKAYSKAENPKFQISVGQDIVTTKDRHAKVQDINKAILEGVNWPKKKPKECVAKREETDVPRVIEECGEENASKKEKVLISKHRYGKLRLSNKRRSRALSLPDYMMCATSDAAKKTERSTSDAFLGQACRSNSPSEDGISIETTSGCVYDGDESELSLHSTNIVAKESGESVYELPERGWKKETEELPRGWKKYTRRVLEALLCNSDSCRQRKGSLGDETANVDDHHWKVKFAHSSCPYFVVDEDCVQFEHPIFLKNLAGLIESGMELESISSMVSVDLDESQKAFYEKNFTCDRDQFTLLGSNRKDHIKKEPDSLSHLTQELSALAEQEAKEICNVLKKIKINADLQRSASKREVSGV